MQLILFLAALNKGVVDALFVVVHAVADGAAGFFGIGVVVVVVA